MRYLGNSSFSLEIWIRLDERPDDGAYRHLFEHSIRDAEYGIVVEGQSGLVLERFAGGQRTALSVTMPTLARWHHVVATASPFALWLDGTLHTGSTVQAQPSAPPEPFSIGSKSQQSPSFHGAVSEIAVYDHVLDESRIRAHYTVGSGTP